MFSSKRNVFTNALMSAALMLCLIVPAIAQETQQKIPSRLTLADAENLLLQRNLTVIAARYQVEATRAAKPDHRGDDTAAIRPDRETHAGQIGERRSSCPRTLSRARGQAAIPTGRASVPGRVRSGHSRHSQSAWRTDGTSRSRADCSE